MFGEVLDPFWRTIHQMILEAARGNIAHAAKVMGIQRSTMHERIQRMGIDVEDIRKKYGIPQLDNRGDLDLDKITIKPPGFAVNRPFDFQKMQWILYCLKEANYNRTKAAELAGVSVRTVRHQLSKARSMGYNIPEPK